MKVVSFTEVKSDLNSLFASAYHDNVEIIENCKLAGFISSSVDAITSRLTNII